MADAVIHDTPQARYMDGMNSIVLPKVKLRPGEFQLTLLHVVASAIRGIAKVFHYLCMGNVNF